MFAPYTSDASHRSIMSTDSSFRAHQNDISQLMAAIPSMNLAPELLSYLFELADTDRNASLSEKEVMSLVEYLNLPFNSNELKEMFTAFDADKSDALTFDEFLQFVYLLINELFKTLMEGNSFTRCNRYSQHNIVIKLDEACKNISWSGRHLLICFSSNPCGIINLDTSDAKIQSGQVTPIFSRGAAAYRYTHNSHKNRTFSLIYFEDNKEKYLDLISPSKQVHVTWCRALEILLKGVSLDMENMSIRSKYLKYMFDTADTDNSGRISSDEISKLVDSMGICKSDMDFKNAFKSVDVDENGELDRDEFKDFIHSMCRRLDLIPLWNVIVNGNMDLLKDVNGVLKFDATSNVTTSLSYDHQVTQDQRITVDQFQHFWSIVQETDINNDMPSIDFKKAYPSGFIRFNDFVVLLTCKDNFIIGRDQTKLIDDMSHPLSHYFINSSHNTYLEGNQFTSSSSVKRYINDLTAGIRCIEIDTWDGTSGEPEVTHGHTLTSAILFRDVIETIDKYAFITSEFPVIISLENHCSTEYQRKIVEILKEVLQDTLVLPSGKYGEPNILLQSPDELRRKIIIKGIRNSDMLVNASELESQDESKIDEGEDDDSCKVMSSDDAGSCVEREKSSPQSTPSRMYARSIVQVITDDSLSGVAYLSKHNVLQFNMSILSDHIGSYKEARMEQINKDPKQRALWLQFNKTHLSRIYPNFVRFDSSNYNPLGGWGAGAQLVALNTQTPGVPLMLNSGMFRNNGGCGYVLKPAYMLHGAYQRQEMIKLKLNVISGQNLPRPDGNISAILSPRIEVTLHEVSETGRISRKTCTTSVIKNNAFDPVWNQVFDFTVDYPELAQLSFRCLHDNDSCVANASFSLKYFRSGLRMVQLFDAFGRLHSNYTFATLFVHLNIAHTGEIRRPTPIMLKDLIDTSRVERKEAEEDIQEISV